MISGRTSILELSRICAEIGFCLLFPVFFFYHLAVTSQLIPGIFGGLFGPITVVLTAIFILAAPAILARYGRGGKNVIFAFALIFFYCAFWFIIHHHTTSASYREEAAEQVLGLLFAWLALFVIGVILPVQRARLHWMLGIGLGLIACTVFLLFDSETMMFNPRSLYEFSDRVATYQGYARSAFLTALFLLGVSSTVLGRAGVSIVAIPVLFLLGARSELFGFIAIVGVLFLMDGWRSGRRAVVLLAAVGASAAFLAGHIDDFMASRQAQVLDISHATSWVSRNEYQALALQQIAEHPLVGSYGGNFEAGGKGSYAHNALSAWVSFGLPGFCMYVGLTLYCATVSFARLRRQPSSGSAWRLSFCVNLAALLLIVVAKPVFWAVPAFGWGLVVNAMGSDTRRSGNR